MSLIDDLYYLLYISIDAAWSYLTRPSLSLEPSALRAAGLCVSVGRMLHPRRTLYIRGSRGIARIERPAVRSE